MKDEWLKAALTDETVVVELLLRLKQSSSDADVPSSSKPPSPPLPIPIPLCWGQRFPRSKLANVVVRMKESTTTTITTATRCSPTTPLSWSDGGYDESCVSRAPSDLSTASRSKGIICTSEATTNTSSVNKRSIRKRRFAYLKEKESTLLNERIQLKRELESMHVSLEEQRARSENFKRFKIDMNRQSREMGAASGKAKAMVSDPCNQSPNRAQSVLPRYASRDDDRALSNSCRADAEVETNKRHFILPDLNMMPTEEEIAVEI